MIIPDNSAASSRNFRIRNINQPPSWLTALREDYLSESAGHTSIRPDSPLDANLLSDLPVIGSRNSIRTNIFAPSTFMPNSNQTIDEESNSRPRQQQTESNLPSSRRCSRRGRHSALEDVEDSMELMRRRQESASSRPNLDSQSMRSHLTFGADSDLEAPSVVHSQFAPQDSAIQNELSEPINFRSNPLLESLDAFNADLDSQYDEMDPAVEEQAPPITVEEVEGAAKDIHDKCAICQEDLNRRDFDSSYLNCMHWYHYECIKAWLERKSECPTCKHETTNIFKIFDPNNPLSSEEDNQVSNQQPQPTLNNPLLQDLSHSQQEPTEEPQTNDVMETIHSVEEFEDDFDL